MKYWPDRSSLGRAVEKARVFVHSASMVECADIGIKILFVQILYRNTKKKLVKLHEVNVWNCSETTWSKNYPGFNSQNVKNIVNRRKFKPVNFFQNSQRKHKNYLGRQILNRQPTFFCFWLDHILIGKDITMIKMISNYEKMKFDMLNMIHSKYFWFINFMEVNRWN